MTIDPTTSRPDPAALVDPLARLTAGEGGDDARLTRLRDGLGGQAAAEALLDVAYRVLDSPIGPLLLAATDAGLVRVAFAGQDHEAALRALAAHVGPRILRAPGRLDAWARELDAFFDGSLREFAAPLDLRLSRGFRRGVLDHLRGVPYGATTTYAALAALTGSAGAVRAVGSACATNPLPIVVPCHRVLRSDGGLGGYAGGLPAKRLLLDLECGQNRLPRAVTRG